MSWFYLALLAPFLFAIVNLIDDNLLSFVYKDPFLATTFAGFFGALPLLSRFFIYASPLPLKYILLAEAAGLLTVMYYFFYFRGLESDSPSTVIALFSIATGLLPIFAYYLLGEKLFVQQILGFGIVLLASFGLAVGSLKSIKFSKAIIPVLLGAVFVDAAALLTKELYNSVPFYSGYIYFSLGMGAGGLGFYMLQARNNFHGIRRIKSRIKRVLPVLIVAEMIGLAAELTLNLAISRGPVSLVKIIEDVQPMFVLLITLVLYPISPRYFREAEEGGIARKLILMLLALTGLAVIGFSSQGA